MRNLSLKTLALLIAVVPLLGFLAAGSVIVLDKRAVVREMDAVRDFAAVAAEASALAHELQRERGTSAVFIGSKGQQMAAELPQQRVATDAARATLDRALASFDCAGVSARCAELVAGTVAELDKLDDLRAQIDSLALAGADSFKYFTAAIRRLLDIVAEGGRAVSDPAVAQALAAYGSLLEAKERAGQERGAGAAGFAAGTFDPAQFRRYHAAAVEHALYLRSFAAAASEPQKQQLEQILADPLVAESERMRALATDAGAGGDLQGITGPAWYKAMTDRIDLLKQLEDRLAADLLAVAQAVSGQAQNQFVLWLTVGGVLILLSSALALVMARSMARSIRGMTDTMGRLAAGDKGVVIEGAERRNEIGAMAKAVQVFKDNAIAMERLQAEQKEAEARAAAEKRRAMQQLAAEFEAGVGGIVQTVSAAANEMQAAASSMTATAEETSRQSAAVAAASEQASTNVQTVASAAEELSNSVSEISRQVAQSSAIAGKAVSEAERTNALVQGLVEAAQKIGAVTSLINEIASQTNLLALNATIEAARAGEAGKGFAVVASEVKSLANQTAKATEEIGAQIVAMQNATGETVSAIQGIGATIGQINEIATTIAAAVEEQGAATQEIARNVSQAAAGTQEVSGNIAGVTQAAGETGAAASQVLNAAGELSRQGEQLRTQVDSFLAAVRAA